MKLVAFIYDYIIVINVTINYAVHYDCRTFGFADLAHRRSARDFVRRDFSAYVYRQSQICRSL